MASIDNDTDEWDWELCKENVQPLKHGRNVSHLTTALQSNALHDKGYSLKEQTQAFELELRTYEGEDPFDVWDRYIKWTERSYPTGGINSCLLPLLQQCVTTFSSGPFAHQYQNDPRYIRAWLKFANLVPTPMDVFTHLYDHQIGTMVAEFYHLWACELEKQGNMKRAQAIYMSGVEIQAEPLDWLQSRYREFEVRTVRETMQRSQEECPPLCSDEQRTALGQLKQGKLGKVGTMRTGCAKLKQAPKSAETKPLHVHQKDNFSVYTEEAVPSLSLPPPTKQRSVPHYAQMNRENEQTPVVWTSVRARQHQSSAVKEAVASSKPLFSVHEDSDQPMVTPRKLPEVGNQVLSSHKPEKVKDVLDELRRTAQSENEPHQMSMYRRDLVYCGNSSLQFEELRASKWHRAHEIHLVQQEREKLKEEMAKRKQAEEVLRAEMAELQEFKASVSQFMRDLTDGGQRNVFSQIPKSLCGVMSAAGDSTGPTSSPFHPSCHDVEMAEVHDHTPSVTVEAPLPPTRAGVTDTPYDTRRPYTVPHPLPTSTSLNTAPHNLAESGSRSGGADYTTPDSSLYVVNHLGSGGTTGSLRSLRAPGSGSLRQSDSMLAPSPTMHTKEALKMMMGIFNKTLDMDRSYSAHLRPVESMEVSATSHPPSAFTVFQDPPSTAQAGTVGDAVSRGLPFAIHYDDPATARAPSPLPTVSGATSNAWLPFTIHCDDPAIVRAPSPLPTVSGATSNAWLPFAIHCDDPATERAPSPLPTVSGATSNAWLPFAIHCDDPATERAPSPLPTVSGATSNAHLPFAIHCDDPAIVRAPSPLPAVSGATRNARLPFAIHCDDLPPDKITQCHPRRDNNAADIYATRGDARDRGDAGVRDESVGGHYQSSVYHVRPNDDPDHRDQSLMSRRSMGLPLAGTISHQSQDSQHFADDITIAQPGSLHDFMQHAHVMSTPFVRNRPDTRPTADSQTQHMTQLEQGAEGGKGTSVGVDVSSVTDLTHSTNLALSSVQQDKNTYNLSPIFEGSDEDRMLSSMMTSGSHILATHHIANTTASTTSSQSGDDRSSHKPASRSKPRPSIGRHLNNIQGFLADFNDSDDDHSGAADVFTVAAGQHHKLEAHGSGESDAVKAPVMRDRDVCGGNVGATGVDAWFNTARRREQGDDCGGTDVALTSETHALNFDISAGMEQMEVGGDELAEPVAAQNVSKLDPFSDETIKSFLTVLKSKIKTWPSYHEVHANFPVLKAKKSTNICLDGTDYMIDKVLAVGGYATVYMGEKLHFSGPDAGLPCALKVQSPPFLWEFYVMKELHARLANATTLFDRDSSASLCDVREGYFFEDKSCLVTDLCPLGTILSFVNNYRSSINSLRLSLEPFATYVLIELLCILEQMHACGIIHADIKPDNFVLMTKMPSVHRSNDPDIVFGTTTCMLKLIDFGQAIDMTLYPPHTTFNSKVDTDGFQCIEMQNNRPWTYQTDLYGLLGTMHVVMFGDYMKVHNIGGIYKTNSSMPRSWNQELWKTLFHDLLNVPDCQHMPDLAEIRRSFEQHFIHSNLLASFNSLVRKMSL